MSDWDVIVIGAGAMGSAAAWHLAREGRAVLVLEQFDAGHHRGSSHGASRIFRLAYDEPDYVRLAQAALPLWRELEDDAGVALLDTTGGLDHGDAPSVRGVAAALTTCGAAVETLTPTEAGERWPQFVFEGSVLFQPDAGRCRSEDTVRALHRRATALGADVRFDQGPVHYEVRGEGIAVRARDEEHCAPVVVIAAGAWASRVATGIALPPLTVTQEQVFHFPPRVGGEWPSFIHHTAPAHYGLETPGEGVKVAEHGGGLPCDPDHRDFAVDAAGRERVVRYVERWIPGLDPSPVSGTTCLYTTTPTSDFVIDREGPVVVAAGFSGHGFKFTPIIGRIVADLALGRNSTPARFRLR